MHDGPARPPHPVRRPNRPSIIVDETMKTRLGSLLVLGFVLVTTSAAAAGIDLHRMWDDRCSGCHGHAGAFARQHLRVVDGRLVGHHPDRDMRRFLHNHYLAADEIDAVYAMLLAQAGSSARFKQQCGQCHGSASGFIRKSLVLRDGVLYGRTSDRPVHRFLEHHRGLSPDDAAFFTDVLTRVAHEVYRP
ncbi:MAG: hypothetical protein P8076_09705 [Gammaproteobacteria bacterium]